MLLQCLILAELPKYLGLYDISKLAQTCKYYNEIVKSGRRTIAMTITMHCSEAKIIKLVRALVFGLKTKILWHIHAKIPGNIRAEIPFYAVEFGHDRLALFEFMSNGGLNHISFYFHCKEYKRNDLLNWLGRPNVDITGSEEYMKRRGKTYRSDIAMLIVKIMTANDIAMLMWQTMFFRGCPELLANC